MPIRQVDIIKNNTFLHTRQPMEKEVNLTFVDNQPSKGESYYYVRVIQVDDHEIGCKWCDWAARHGVTQCDILVNCTPVGMHPNVNESPIHASYLKPGLTVFDTVYTPERTQLLRDAESRGCGVVSGVEMFVRQAAAQFELFTGLTPDREQMRELLRKAMSPLTRAMREEAVKSGLTAANTDDHDTDTA